MAVLLQRGEATFRYGDEREESFGEAAGVGLGLTDEFACFPVILLDEVAVIWASKGGHDVLAYYTAVLT